ncbi:MAG TPA: hypothetical protein VGR00_09165 [Thermoanaerobaculia bacterium]|nr:hypothetical protein [Thermoanaerobaculia bacterium]
MSARRLEELLARLYTDPGLLEAFVSDRRRTAAAAGLSAAEIPLLEAMDITELRLAATSFAAKRARVHRKAPRKPAWRREA